MLFICKVIYKILLKVVKLTSDILLYMREIIKCSFSDVKACYLRYDAKILYRLILTLFPAYKWLFIIFCFVCSSVTAQEIVQASFSNFDYQGCAPVKIQFTDNSTGNPTEWFWDFGDGQTSTKSNPATTYKIPGIYIVKLVVKNAVSIDSTFNELEISGAQAAFDYTYNNICTVPATVDFTVKNQRNKVVYRWNFGDGQVSIFPNTSNTYKSSGLFNVKLTTISPEGCEDSLVKVIQIGSGTADFIAPATGCINDSITFTDISTPLALSGTWKIDNTVVQASTGNLTYLFKKAGIYTIQLSENFGACNNAATKQIQIFNKPTAAYSLNGTLKSCNFPSAVQFNNNSINATSFKWYFGDGDSSVELNPVHTYQAGHFSPILIAYNANGCTDTLNQTDAVFLGGPIINSFNLPDSGCIPLPVIFSADIISPEPIASYLWDFGDGATDVTAQPNHTYTTPGRYNVSLTITTASGCTTTQIVSKAVSAGTRSVPDFNADKTSVCGSEKVMFNGSASGSVSYWYWKVNNLSIAFTQNTEISFDKIGSKTVKLIVSNSGCLDSAVKRDYLFVKPPVSKFKMQFDCNNRSQVKFIDRSIEPRSWSWNFGDASPVSTEQNPPEHVFPGTGRYIISLTTTNDGCTDTFRDTIYIRDKKPEFSYIPADGLICRKADVTISVDNPSYIVDYLWNLDDGRTLLSDTNIVYSYYKTGTYFPSLIVRYTNGCQDTVYSPDPLIVTGPTASFSAVSAATCFNDTTLFVDKSFSDGEHDIINRMWSYGDGISESNNTDPYAHVI